MILRNLSTDEEIAHYIQSAYTFTKRLKGLMFTDELNSGYGLHILPCQSVHTHFMRYPIDVVYCNKSLYVIDIDENLPPGKFGKRRKGAHSVLELPTGTVAHSTLQIGHQLELR
ncbi:DUF192 domain-containing protein [Tenuibacillus multivorans]|uniref:DUF192 domain-containing protein n=1 Tax=Tenuibacillus multivorans TaxID=237069 RepID=A0A1G9WP14_9BACI|nr:DUF192 domain-containing protein [Tenuibacillus multivorans]GEL77989.1 hypothetical protein TMU01_22240 [Tenuibacillus multivorans]SDM86189.1 hypothetical protein SAMN05216498_0828 [Tenuibacillus multivorans]